VAAADDQQPVETFDAEAVGEGAIAPTAITVDTGRAGAADDPSVKAAVTRLIDGLKADPEVASIAFDSSRQSVDPTGRYLNIEVLFLRSSPSGPLPRRFVVRARPPRSSVRRQLETELVRVPT
jgi:hypothetical protein